MSSPPHATLLPRLGGGAEWLPANAGESGARVYRRSDGAVFAKCVLADGVPELAAERDRVAWLAATDVPCPEYVDWHESAEGACLVTGAVDGVPASEVSVGAVPRVIASMSDVFRRLHGLPTSDCPFDRRLRVTMPTVEDVVRRGAVDVRNLEPGQQRTPPIDLLAVLLAELDRVAGVEAGDLVVCHGDACLPNVLVDPGTYECVGLVDLGRLGVADRYLDLSLLHAQLASPEMNEQFSESDALALLRACGVANPDHDRLRFYRLLDALSWG